MKVWQFIGMILFWAVVFFPVFIEAGVRIPLHCDHSFRWKLSTDSAAL
jgi:hypothetical protein